MVVAIAPDAFMALPRGKGVKRNIFELRDRGSAVAKA
jgi:hypothetical protein